MTDNRSFVSTAGFTLVEAMSVLVMMGIVLAMGFPVLGRALVRSDVRSARNVAVSLYHEARASALETGRVTTLTFAGNRALITATPRLVGAGAVDTVGHVQDLGVLYGVTVSATPSNTMSVDPRGLGSSVSTTVFFDRTGRRDSMVVTGFGRVIR